MTAGQGHQPSLLRSYGSASPTRFHRCEAAKAVAPEPWRRRIGSTKLVAADHGSIHHFNAAVRTGASHSAVVSASSRLTVSEQPAMSSEVT